MGETFNFSQFDNKYLTEQEKAEINGYRKMAQDGVITWKDANTFAEQIRAKYGYSGGADGAGYTPLPKAGTETTVPALQQHQSKMGSTDFDEYLKTARAKGLKERYEQAGKLAMQDTVGDIAARTGGLASSYAGVAGQQVYGQYMQGLEDAQQENFDKELARAQQKEQTAYQRLLNQMTMDENKAKTLAAYGDFSGYKALGYTDEQIANMEATYQASLVKDKDGGSELFDSVLKVAQGYDDIEDAEAYLNRCVDNGFISADDAYMIYSLYLGGDPVEPTTYQGGETPFLMTYKDLKAMYPIVNIMTEEEFDKSGAKWKYNTYQKYLAEMYEILKNK